MYVECIALHTFIPVSRRFPNQSRHPYDSLQFLGNVHFIQNSKHIFPKMKMRDLVPTFYIPVIGSDLYIPMIGLIWNICFPVLRERTLGSTARKERRAGNCCQAEVDGSSLPSPQLLRLSREFTYIND
jgi:hypothetical protein